MIIKSDFVWILDKGRRLGIFSGYYDMLDEWSNISTVYLNYHQLTDLVKTIAKLPSFPVKLIRTETETKISGNETDTALFIDTLYVEGAWHSLYRLPVSLLCQGRWVNWNRLEDTTKFTWDELYKAVVAGVKKGMTQISEPDFPINHSFPQEWAWRFTTQVSGPFGTHRLAVDNRTVNPEKEVTHDDADAKR